MFGEHCVYDFHLRQIPGTRNRVAQAEDVPLNNSFEKLSLEFCFHAERATVLNTFAFKNRRSSIILVFSSLIICEQTAISLSANQVTSSMIKSSRSVWVNVLTLPLKNLKR